MNRRSFMMAGAASALAPHFLSANAELAAADYRALGTIRDLGLAAHEPDARLFKASGATSTDVVDF